MMVHFLNSIIDGNKYFALDEILLANELWDLLSGSNDTMESILKIINKIATKEFLKRFNFISESNNRKKEPHTYRNFLKDWFMFSEIELLDNDLEITKNIRNQPRAIRIYNQSIFKSDNYNFERYNFLINTIK